MRIALHPNHPDPRKIRRAVDALRRGGVIAYPTDTVYGIGCDIFQKKAVDRIYRMKALRNEHKLTFICPNLSNIARFAIVDDQAYRVMRKLLPGAYTFILPATRDVPRVLMMKRKTVGIRIPDHPVPRALVSELGHPLATTSASWDDEPLADPDEIDDRYRELDLVLDGGPGGLVSSTVVDLSGDVPVVEREGAGSLEPLGL